MDILLLAMLQAQEPRPQGGSITGLLMPFVLIFFFFWVLILVPQRRQMKAHQDMVAALQKGDQVVTAGGLVGVITGVRDDTIELKTGASTVVVERSRVTRRVDATQAKQG